MPTLAVTGVSLDLTPMQISESTAQSGRDLRVEKTAEQPSEIVVHPGELYRVALKLKNWESQSQTLTLKIDGTFPLQWCQTQAEPSAFVPETALLEQGERRLVTLEIPAKQSGYADLWFLVPQQFFEDQAIFSETFADHLELNFRGCLSVYPTPRQGGKRSPIQQSHFQLYVRPRSTYTNFLPTVYQEVEFIHRFMTIFEAAFEPVVNSFSSMWAILDPLTAPQSLLPFIAHWLAWPHDSEVSLHHQRRLIRHAVEIYRFRGTRKGLRFYLHLYTDLPLDEEIGSEADKSISITEPSGQGCLLGIAQMGIDAVLGGGKPYHFEVRLRCGPDDAIDEPLVRRIIEQEKPAFCTYGLCIERSENS